MLQGYATPGLNQPAAGEQAAEIVAAAQPNNANVYLQIVEYATLAHDTRTADLAAAKALALAPRVSARYR